MSDNHGNHIKRGRGANDKRNDEKRTMQETPLVGRGYVSNVVSVPEKDRGQRPVINES